MIPINILPPELSTNASIKTISPKTNNRTATALSQRKIDVNIMPCFDLSNLKCQELTRFFLNNSLWFLKAYKC